MACWMVQTMAAAAAASVLASAAGNQQHSSTSVPRSRLCCVLAFYASWAGGQALHRQLQLRNAQLATLLCSCCNLPMLCGAVRAGPRCHLLHGLCG